MSKEAAKQIRKELKAQFGYTAKQVSVRSNYGSIDIVIKDKTVSFAKIEKVSEKYKSVSRCEVTGEILSGGNTFVILSIASVTIGGPPHPYVLLADMSIVSDCSAWASRQRNARF